MQSNLMCLAGSSSGAGPPPFVSYHGPGPPVYLFLQPECAHFSTPCHDLTLMSLSTFGHNPINNKVPQENFHHPDHSKIGTCLLVIVDCLQETWRVVAVR